MGQSGSTLRGVLDYAWAMALYAGMPGDAGSLGELHSDEAERHRPRLILLEKLGCRVHQSIVSMGSIGKHLCGRNVWAITKSNSIGFKQVLACFALTASILCKMLSSLERSCG